MARGIDEGDTSLRRRPMTAHAHALAAHAPPLLLPPPRSQTRPIVFIPLWLFHAVVSRSRFSLPAPLSPHNHHWAPCHSIVATPLLVAFELLLCVYLQSVDDHGEPVVSLKLVFLPLLAFELTIFIDNIRMCSALMPVNDETASDRAIWKRLPHFWVAISMVFLVAATLFTLLKLSGDIGGLSWWDLFINFGIAECFAFLVCTKWSNPLIGRQPSHFATTSFTLPRYSRWYCGSSSSSLEDYDEDRFCGLQDIGSYVMKVPLLIFQVLLCMRLERTPPGAQFIPIFALYSPIFLLQVTGISVALWRLLEKLVLLVRSGSVNERYVAISSKIYDFFTLVHHGSRLLSWWSIDERSNEEKARLYHAGTTGYNTFSGYAPEMLKKMPKKVLIKEVSRLQVVLGEQTEIAKNTQEEYERLQNERVLCRICFEKDVRIVLLPCRHCTLCQPCSARCQTCPICRVPIKKRITINDREKLNHASDQDHYVDLKSIMHANFV
uniref:RING-type domain-containing protein n=1 Tax=Ananas comosus var. bracteatus TaxID=296719 RepID=A0A6V7P7A7_ANACO|nr:unnamed protein product [Ananas comosus var. bracteatus]